MRPNRPLPPPQLVAFLQSNMMGAFVKHFEAFGVTTLPDLCDPLLVTDSDLKGEYIGMDDFQVGASLAHALS